MKKRRIERVFCAVLVCMLLSTAVTAKPDEEGTQTETTEEREGAAQETPAPEPTVEPDPQQTPEPTAEPDPQPTLTPSPEAEGTPVPESTPTPTPKPERTPEPHAEKTLTIFVTNGVVAEDGSCVLRYRSEQDMAEITWNGVDGAAGYLVGVYIDETAVFETDTDTASLAVPVSNLFGEEPVFAEDGTYTCVLRVCACADGKTLAEAELALSLVPEEGGKRPKRGFSHRGFGKNGKKGAQPEEEAGFRVTPGEALTKSHSAGDQSMRRYGSVVIESSDTPTDVLYIGNETIRLDGGSGMFTVDVEDGTLTLTPEDSGSVWSFTAKALKTLRRSGIEALYLDTDDGRVCLDTASEMTGDVYAQLCAQGYVSKDYALRVDAFSIQTSVGGRSYLLSETWELPETEG